MKRYIDYSIRYGKAHVKISRWTDDWTKKISDREYEFERINDYPREILTEIMDNLIWAHLEFDPDDGAILGMTACLHKEENDGQHLQTAGWQPDNTAA